jgi:formate dehydrogenase major subunit
MSRRTAALNREVPTGYVEISSQDARKVGTRDGDIVAVTTRRGTIRIKAKVTPRVHQGVVFIPFHFAECAANILTNPALDPVAKIPEFKACACRVEKG